MRALRILTALTLAMAASMAPAQPGAYPTRPIRLVVPYAPGGVSDITGRIVAQKMSELLGQSVVVENRAGAGGMLGTGAVAKAEPDGYTVVLSSLSAYAIGPRLVKTPPYDPIKDFTAIGPVALSPTILTVNTALPFQSVQDVIAFAKANPGKLSYGSSGIGSVAHISAEMLRASTGIELVHVPYKSAAQAYPDMIAGSISMIFDALPSAIQHIRAGKARPIAMMSDRRASLLPEVPTFAEAGYPQATLRLWVGVHGPANLPAPIVQKLNDTLVKVAAAPDVRERLTAVGADAYATTPQEFAQLVRGDVEKLGAMMAAAGIKAE
jgi:tripartite-type tricarboxylate transporter receptor subunit TctC